MVSRLTELRVQNTLSFWPAWLLLWLLRLKKRQKLSRWCSVIRPALDLKRGQPSPPIYLLVDLLALYSVQKDALGLKRDAGPENVPSLTPSLDQNGKLSEGGGCKHTHPLFNSFGFYVSLSHLRHRSV